MACSARQARILYVHALAIFEGGDRAGVATIYYQLGVLAQERGKHDPALDWYRKALAHYEESLPTNHPDLARARKSYTSLLDQLGRSEKASKLRNQAEIQPPSQPAHAGRESKGAFGITRLLRGLFGAAR